MFGDVKFILFSVDNRLVIGTLCNVVLKESVRNFFFFYFIYFCNNVERTNVNRIATAIFFSYVAILSLK